MFHIAGALTTMPAVRQFALYAAMAVLFDFFFQITCFISLMTIDAKRQGVKFLYRNDLKFSDRQVRQCRPRSDCS